ncbi:MAG: imidazole glycerol phosphate synthase, glutamine amidotransferase subunit [Alphaproteobacteria bacterium 65-7]|nr:MAG: imidazole glycerol phosphate synthase, glutamine amidotransferase subunit [Alphaproteobacteria bacterium 65-7]
MITLVDYGLGNIQAFANIYNRLNIPVTVARDAQTLANASRMILPGVGHFDWAMKRLADSGMRQTLDDLVVRQKKPVLGICVGMQMMAKRSDEGELPGLGWIDAEVKKFDVTGSNRHTQLPHMGWNDVSATEFGDIFGGMEGGSRFYFLHSYYFAPNRGEEVVGKTDYNGTFASAVRAGNVFGVQFHPEKSHRWGIQLLKNFAEL